MSIPINGPPIQVRPPAPQPISPTQPMVQPITVPQPAINNLTPEVLQKPSQQTGGDFYKYKYYKYKAKYENLLKKMNNN